MMSYRANTDFPNEFLMIAWESVIAARGKAVLILFLIMYNDGVIYTRCRPPPQ